MSAGDPSELEARAFELEAQAALLRAQATRLRATFTPAATSPAGPLRTADAAKKVRLSVSSLRRLAPEAPAGVLAGGSAALRWNLEPLRAWLESRGRRATPYKREPKDDAIDVDAIAARAGLRAVAGGRNR